jgi:hypothetical protein
LCAAAQSNGWQFERWSAPTAPSCGYSAMSNLQNPIFTHETKAREWLGARVWPQGPICPHCGVTSEYVTKLEGGKHRPGLYQCNECREQFTVTVKTVFERSKIPRPNGLPRCSLLRPRRRGVPLPHRTRGGEADRLALSIGPLAGLDQVKEPGSAGREAGGGRGLGQIRLSRPCGLRLSSS